MNVLLIDYFIKHYQTAFIVDFIIIKKNAFRLKLQ